MLIKKLGPAPVSRRHVSSGCWKEDSLDVSPKELARQWLDSAPFVRHLGMKVVSMDGNTAVIELPFVSDLATMGDAVHGGAIGALIDTASAAAAWSGADEVASLKGSTVSLTVAFTSAARSADLTCTATVVRRGGTLCFIEAAVRDPRGSLIATGLVTYKLG